MKSKYERYTKEIIDGILEDILNPQIKTASESARNIGIDVSGLIKHLKTYRILRISGEKNKCGMKLICEYKNKACNNCFYLDKYKQEKRCASCKVNCNTTCKDINVTPTCALLNKYPYVCNGCSKKERCHLNKFIYDADEVYKNICHNRSEPRKGTHASNEEFNRLSNLLKPLIIQKHQSLTQIFQAHKNEIRWSYPTILSFIDKGLIPGIKNIDLTKRVKYPTKYKKDKNQPTNFAYLTGRTYDDFITYISDNPFIEVVEMDTVLSKREDDSCLLTLLFRKSNFMLAFLLKNKKVEEVRKIFDSIKDQLGLELYKKTFQCILTDNGSEFADPRFIEFDLKSGEKITNLFYCDPGKSGQKGKIEKNHVELRKVFPKGCSFSTYTQEDINLALSHINSEPRAILNSNCPGSIARAFIDDKVMNLIKYQIIPFDDVVLHPSLFTKK